MKKLFTTVIAVSFGIATFAQQAVHIAINPRTAKFHKAIKMPKNVKRLNHQTAATTQGVTTILLNNESADSVLYPGTYTNSGWAMNSHYSWPADSAVGNPINFAAVAFDSIYDANNNVGYKQSVVSGLIVDSIYIDLGQQNASGMADTLVVNLMPVNTNGYPTGAPLATVTKIIQPGAPLTGNWLSFGQFAFGFNTAISGKAKFAVQVKYLGNKMDTLGFLAGFGSFSAPCPTTTATLANNTFYNPIKATTPFVANSFSELTQYASYGTLPTSTGANVYYDCNGNGTYDPGTDGASYIQDIYMVALVTFNNTTGINDGRTMDGLTLGQCYPNPASSTASVGYELSNNTKSVDFKIYDVTGRLNQGAQTAGTHIIQVNVANLAAGTYYYSLNADSHRLTNRMVVVK